MKRTSRGFTLVELLIVVAIIGMIAAIAIPNLLNAVDKGKQKRTMSDMRAIGTAIESYAVDNAVYPIAANMVAVKALIDPYLIKNIPLTDGWAHPIQEASTATAYTIYSLGKDGTGSNCATGTTSNFNEEICFVGGQFTRFPAGPQQ
jgi:type II secretion system protein G